MSALRFLSATLLSAVSAFSMVTASGCGTEAFGVDDCRDIEQARCDAGAACGQLDDAAACRRYYRDHCLHGLSARATAGASVANCVALIKAAGACAAEDPGVELGDDCPVTEAKRNLLTACDVVARPELAAECAFLQPEASASEGGQGNGGAPASSTGGAGGNGPADNSPGGAGGAGGQADE